MKICSDIGGFVILFREIEIRKIFANLIKRKDGFSVKSKHVKNFVEQFRFCSEKKRKSKFQVIRIKYIIEFCFKTLFTNLSTISTWFYPFLYLLFSSLQNLFLDALNWPFASFEATERASKKCYQRTLPTKKPQALAFFGTIWLKN